MQRSLRVPEPESDSVDFQELNLDRRLWRRQRDICRAIEKHRRVAIKGCHASGKTHVVAPIALEHLAKYKDGKVFIFAPTLRQVKTFIQQIEIARKRCPELGFPECGATGLKINEDRYILGASSTRGVNIQGLHGTNVLIICDEAPGIDQGIWDAIEGVAAGGSVQIVMLGNPVVPSGTFYNAFGKERLTWHTITISAFDTPNLQNRAAKRPYTIEELLDMTDEELGADPFIFLIRRRWVRDRYLAWGAKHPRYVARVLGEFPSQSEYNVFSLEWIEAAAREATEAELQKALGHYIQFGIDVAGGGEDETTLAARVDGIILEQRVYRDRNPGPRIIADLRAIESRYANQYRTGPVVCDIIGVGLNLAPIIAEAGFYVVGFQAGATPMDTRSFRDSKTEIYWTSRTYFRDGLVSGLQDEETKAQLSDVLFEETYKGTKVESKDDAKARGVGSPDRAEALIMAFMPIIPSQQYIQYGQPTMISPV